MQVRPLTEQTILAEACCGSGHRLLGKSDLTEHERTELRAAGMKVEWLKKMIPKGLSAQIAYDGEGSVGFIEYMPIELSNFHEGKDLYIVNCMTAPHAPPGEVTRRQRIPGCGSALVRAMFDDVQGKCDGIVTPFGFAYTRDMSGFFCKLGFEEFENEGLKMLIKRFNDPELPRPVRYERKYRFEPVPGKVVVDIFWGSHCPSDPQTLLNFREVCGEFGDRVILNETCVDGREALAKCGMAWGRYVNGEYPWSTLGPVDKEEMREVLSKALEGQESAE